jgi:zinc D-Ala-D-Ala carboxypeptidase
MMKLTEHFTLEELIQSDTAERRGIFNEPDVDVVEQLQVTARRLEEVRELLGAPILIKSGYRSPALNAAVGGSRKSQHCRGEAVDFIAPGYGSPKAICQAIEASDIPFDQLIEEGSWVHVSFRGNPRRQVLTARFGPNGVTYTEGLL